MRLPRGLRPWMARKKGRVRQVVRRFEPAQLVLRRLEPRRVLDVTAAFVTATGDLQIDVSGTGETATMAAEGGEITIHDGLAQRVDIQVDGAGPSPVELSDVQRLEARGSGDAHQGLVLDTFLAPARGVVVDSAFEHVAIRQPISRVAENGISIEGRVIEISADLEADGTDLLLGGDVTLRGNTRWTASRVLVTGRVNDDGDASTPSRWLVNGNDLVRFESEIGDTNAVDRLDAAGRTEVMAGITTRQGVFFRDAVVLAGDVDITDTGSSGIWFSSTIDSLENQHHDLTLTAPGGRIRFGGEIGVGLPGDQSLGRLAVTSAADGVAFGLQMGISEVRAAGGIDLGTQTGGIGGDGIVFQRSIAGSLVIRTAGADVRVNGAVRLQSDLAIETDGGNVTFTASAPIDSQPSSTQRLTIDAGSGAVSWNGNLGAVTPLGGLAVFQADAGVSFGNASNATPGGEGPVDRIASTGPIRLGTDAPIGGGISFQGGGATVRITTTGDAVEVNGPVLLASGLEILTGAGPGDIRFTAQAPIDGRPGVLGDVRLDAGEGSVAFNADIGSEAAVGRLSIARAGLGVTFGEADAVTGPGGMGPVARVRAHGGVEIGEGNARVGGSGIVLNAGAESFLLETEGSPVRLNGALTLASNTTISSSGPGPADIVLTNDTPVNSRPGEAHQLMLDAGAGSVRINEDLGAIHPLGALRVERADGGVIIGEASSEIPGSGTLGPVEIIRTSGSVAIGSPTNVIGGTGIVIQGSPVEGTTITTGGTDARFNGPLRLATDTVISTGSGPGGVIFTASTPIESTAGRHSSLHLDAGTGQVIFNADVGVHQSLGTLAVVRAGDGIVLGEAPSIGGARGPVHNVLADHAINLGQDEIVGGTGITLNGGLSGIRLTTAGGLIRFNGVTSLESDVHLETGSGPGDIIFTSAAPVDSSDGRESTTRDARRHITIGAGAGSVIWNANLGARQRLGNLVVERAAKVLVGGAGHASSGGSGPVTELLVHGTIDMGRELPVQNTIAGGILLRAGSDTMRIESATEDIRLNGPVRLESDLEMHAGGNVIFTAAALLDSHPGTAHDLTLSAGQDVRFDAAIGDQQPLGTLQVVSVANLSVERGVSAERVLQLAGSGTTTLRGPVATSALDAAGLDLSGNHFLLEGSFSLGGDGRVNLTHTGVLELADQAIVRSEGEVREQGGGTVRLSGSVITTNDSIHFASPVTLGAANVLLATTSGTASDGSLPRGADIRFGAALDGQVPGGGAFTLDAGMQGNIRFEGSLGTSQRLGGIRIERARDVTVFGASKVAHLHQQQGTGTTSLLGPLDANGADVEALAVSTVDVVIQGTVTTSGRGSVVLDVSGMLDIGADLQLNGSFLEGGGGQVRLDGNLTTTSDAIRFVDAVTLARNVRLDTGDGGGDLSFEGTVDGVDAGAQNLTLATGQGMIALIGAVGTQAELGDVVIESAGGLRIENLAIVRTLRQLSGSGTTELAGPLQVTSADGVAIRSARIVLSGTVQTELAGGPVTLEAGGTLQLSGGVASGAGAVLVSAGGDVDVGTLSLISTDRAPIEVTAGAPAGGNAAGGAIVMQDGALITSQSGQIDLNAPRGIRLGRVTTAGLVRLTTTDGEIADAGDSGGADIEAAEAVFRAATGIGRVDALETVVHQVAAENKLAGGFRIHNAATGPLTIGDVDGLAGIQIGAVDGSTLGDGEVEVIHSGTIMVDRAVRHRAGDHTILRAEIPGDLLLNAPVQNRGGDGWIILFSGSDLIVRDSLPEEVRGGVPTFPEAEVSVEGGGAIRGEARGAVLVETGPAGSAILRTHAERFPDPPPGPTPELPDPRLDPVGFQEALRAIREAFAPQIVHVPPLVAVSAVEKDGATIDEGGRAQLRVAIGDPNSIPWERNFLLSVDWGDGTVESYPIPGNPLASANFQSADGSSLIREPDATVTASFDSGIYFVHHTYREPVDPANPSAPVTVRAELRYDARREGEIAFDATRPPAAAGAFSGIRLFENVSQEIVATAQAQFQPPGIGRTDFIKVVESVIVPVQAAPAVVLPPSVRPTAVQLETIDEFPVSVAVEEADVAGQLRLFLKIVDDIRDVELDAEYPLPSNLIEDPISLFTEQYRFPNGHYRIYLEEIRTRRRRLILDVHIYEGRVVPPNFREGVGRPPQDTAPETPTEGSGADVQQDIPLDAPAESSPVAAGQAATSPTDQNDGRPARRAAAAAGGLQLIGRLSRRTQLRLALARQRRFAVKDSHTKARL